MTARPPLSDADVARLRADYPILAGKTYLVSHSLGAMHRGTRDALAAYAEEWATEGVVAWHRWRPRVRDVGDLVAGLIGAPPGTVVMRANVADALGDVVSCVEWRPGKDGVVATDLDWPGSIHLFREQQRRGARLTLVPGDDDGVTVDVARMVEAVDDHTALVYVSLVLFRSAALLDVRPLVERAHEVGALVVLDAYQAAGTVPFSVQELGVDVCVGGSVKYLCGGPGNGWLYVEPGVADQLHPTTPGWFGQERPFDFDVDVHYAPGVGRFAGGTVNVPAAYAAAPAYAALLDVGIDRVRQRSQAMTQPLLEAALERGYVVRSPHDPARRGGHVALDPGDAQRVSEELIAAGFVVDHRPGTGIRVSPHVYNTPEECDAFLAALDARAPRRRPPPR